MQACKVDNCGRRHNSLLHDKNAASSRGGKSGRGRKVTSVQKKEDSKSTKKKTKKETSGAVNSINQAGEKEEIVILQSCLAWAVSPGGERFKVRVVIDTGAEISLITRNLATKMGLNGKSTSLLINTAGGGTTASSNEKLVKFQIAELEGRYISPQIEAITTKIITQNLREVPIDISKYPHLNGIKFTENFPRDSSEVDILLGVQYANILVNGEPITSKTKGEKAPCAVPTKLGYILSGVFKGPRTKF